MSGNRDRDLDDVDKNLSDIGDKSGGDANKLPSSQSKNRRSQQDEMEWQTRPDKEKGNPDDYV